MVAVAPVVKLALALWAKVCCPLAKGLYTKPLRRRLLLEVSLRIAFIANRKLQTILPRMTKGEHFDVLLDSWKGPLCSYTFCSIWPAIGSHQWLSIRLAGARIRLDTLSHLLGRRNSDGTQNGKENVDFDRLANLILACVYVLVSGAGRIKCNDRCWWWRVV